MNDRSDRSLSFGAAVLARRVAQRLTQADLGLRLGVGQQTVHRWEAGRTLPQLRVRAALADFLQITEGELEGLISGGRSGPAATSDIPEDLREEFDSVIENGVSGEPMFEPRQAALIDALITRIGSGNALSHEDGDAVHLLKSVLHLN